MATLGSEATGPAKPGIWLGMEPLKLAAPEYGQALVLGPWWTPLGGMATVGQGTIPAKLGIWAAKELTMLSKLGALGPEVTGSRVGALAAVGGLVTELTTPAKLGI